MSLKISCYYLIKCKYFQDFFAFSLRIYPLIGLIQKQNPTNKCLLLYPNKPLLDSDINLKIVT